MAYTPWLWSQVRRMSQPDADHIILVNAAKCGCAAIDQDGSICRKAELFLQKGFHF